MLTKIKERNITQFMKDKQPETKVGAPKKRDRVVAEVAEAFNINIASDVLTLEELDGFPNIRDLNKRDQAMMAMVACGFSQGHIAEAFGLAQPTVWEIIQRIDPDGLFKISPKAKKAFITRMAESRAMSAIGSITYNDLLELDADKRANVAQKMMKISQDMNQTKHKDLGGNRMDLLLEQMAAEAEDAEFTEVSDGSK